MIASKDVSLINLTTFLDNNFNNRGFPTLTEIADAESINGLWSHVKIKDLKKAKFMLLIITNKISRWLMQKSLNLIVV